MKELETSYYEIEDYRDKWEELKDAYNALKQEHESLLSRLPKNEDGNVVLWGDECKFKEAMVRGDLKKAPDRTIEVDTIGIDKDGRWHFWDGDIHVCISDPAESCQSAQTEGEGA